MRTEYPDWKTMSKEIRKLCKKKGVRSISENRIDKMGKKCKTFTVRTAGYLYTFKMESKMIEHPFWNDDVFDGFSFYMEKTYDVVDQNLLFV